jgi:nicotinate-nucleotide adenylyltransferase
VEINSFNRHYSNPKERVILLGGSFDPVHFGHLRMAQYAQMHCQAHEVWFIPVGQAWQKQRKLVSAQHRLNMLKLAIEHKTNPQPTWRIHALELEREGPSYTIDTLAYYKQQHPHTEFIWIIGYDQAQNLCNWKQWQTLFDYAKIGVLNRNQQSVKTNPPEALQAWLEKGAIFDISMPNMPMASTHIRAFIRQWRYQDPNISKQAYQQLCQWTPKTVLQYINTNELY